MTENKYTIIGPEDCPALKHSFGLNHGENYCTESGRWIIYMRKRWIFGDEVVIWCDGCNRNEKGFTREIPNG